MNISIENVYDFINKNIQYWTTPQKNYLDGALN